MVQKNKRYHTNIWFKDTITLVDYIFHARYDLFLFFFFGGGGKGQFNAQDIQPWANSKVGAVSEWVLVA